MPHRHVYAGPDYLAVHEKKSGEMQVSESLFLKNDFDETMDFQVFGLLNTWYHGDFLLCIIQPGEIIEYMKTFNPSMSNSEFLKTATNINQFDNPVIMIIKLKSQILWNFILRNQKKTIKQEFINSVVIERQLSNLEQLVFEANLQVITADNNSKIAIC